LDGVAYPRPGKYPEAIAAPEADLKAAKGRAGPSDRFFLAVSYDRAGETARHLKGGDLPRHP
jgi:hypothetical protein